MRELLFSYPLNPNRIRDLFRGNDFTAARLFTHKKKKSKKPRAACRFYEIKFA